MILKFKFDNFESLPSQPDEHTNTESVKDCNGNEWRLRMYPGGESEDNDETKNMLALYLSNMGEHDINASFAMIFRDRAGNVYDECCNKVANSFQAGGGNNWGFPTFLTRAAIIDDANNVLLDGTLSIDVEIQTISKPNEFRRENPFVEKMLKLFEDKVDADVSFKVGSDTISAHKFILKVNAPMLFRFCDGRNGGSHVSIMDVTPEVFNIVMRYIYGGDAPEENVIKKLGKEIIEAATRYGVVCLKVTVETSLVDQRIITKENAVDWLLFADAKTCPLLKEYATAYFSGRIGDMLAHESFKKLEASPRLLKELMVDISNDPTNQINDTSKFWMWMDPRKC